MRQLQKRTLLRRTESKLSVSDDPVCIIIALGRADRHQPAAYAVCRTGSDEEAVKGNLPAAAAAASCAALEAAVLYKNDNQRAGRGNVSSQTGFKRRTGLRRFGSGGGGGGGGSLRGGSVRGGSLRGSVGSSCA